MKNNMLLALSMMISLASFAQSDKMVKWDYSVKKIGDKTYEVHMTANMQGDYHIYAQEVGVDGPVGTTFTFTKNPLITFDGKVKERGKKISKFESVWSGNVNYFEKTVDFVQVVKLKANVKTSLAGKVEFMVCDEKRCLPPGEVDIKVSVGG